MLLGGLVNKSELTVKRWAYVTDVWLNLCEPRGWVPTLGAAIASILLFTGKIIYAYNYKGA